jgi:hypothetical protein
MYAGQLTQRLATADVGSGWDEIAAGRDETARDETKAFRLARFRQQSMAMIGLPSGKPRRLIQRNKDRNTS